MSRGFDTTRRQDSEAEQVDTRTGPAPDGPDLAVPMSAATAASRAQLLGLQNSAGNAAVLRLLATGPGGLGAAGSPVGASSRAGAGSPGGPGSGPALTVQRAQAEAPQPVHTVTPIEESTGICSVQGLSTSDDLAGSTQRVDALRQDSFALGLPTGGRAEQTLTQRDPMADARAAYQALGAAVAADEARLSTLEESPETARSPQAEELRASLAARRQDLAALQVAPLAEVVDGVVQKYGLDLESARRTIEADSSSWQLGPGGLSGAGGQTRYSASDGTGQPTDVVASERHEWSLGLGGYQSTQASSDTVRIGGREWTDSTASTRKLLSGTDLYSSSTRTSSSQQSIGGGSSSVTDAQGRALQAGGGFIGYNATQSHQESGTDPDGGSGGSGSTSSFSAGAAHGASGSGASVKVGRGNSWTQGRLTEQVVRGASGSYTVNLEAVAGTPPSYRITTVLHLGGSASAGVDGADKKDPKAAGGGVSASGEATADLTFVKTMTEEQATGYLGDLKALESGRDVAGPPEYGILARLVAAKTGVGDPMALVDPQAAQSLGDGESMSLDLAAGGTLGGHAGARGVGVTGEVSAGAGRKVTVTRSGQDVLVTVAARSKLGANAGVSAAVELASLGGTVSRSDASSVQYVFRLKTDDQDAFQGNFAAVRTLASAEDLYAFAAEHRELVDARTDSASRETGDSITMGVGGLGLTLDDKHSYSEAITANDKGMSGNFSGGQTSGATAKLGDYTLGQGSIGTSVAAEVDQGGDIAVDLSERRGGSDQGRALAKTRQELAGHGLADDAANVAAKGLSGFLKEHLDRTFAELTNYHLNEDDFDRLVQRAQDAEDWGHAVRSPALSVDAWPGLRIALAEPQPAQEWLDQDPTPDHRQARRLAQAKALARFMSDWGNRDGYDSLVRVLRDWGETGTSLRYSSADELGELSEWPKPLEPTAALYRQLVSEVKAAPGTLSALTSAGQIDAAAGSLTARLQSVLDAINACTEFREPRAKLEMAKDIQGRMNAVTAAAAQARQKVLESQYGQCVDPAAAEPLQSVPAAQSPAAAPALQSTEALQSTSAPQSTPALQSTQSTQAGSDGRAAALAQQRQQLESRLQIAKNEEQRVLQAVLEYLPQKIGGKLGAHWYDGLFENEVKASTMLNRLGEMLGPWIRDIKELRQVYQDSGLAPQAWLVRPTAQDPPRALDPDIAGMITLMQNMARVDTVLANGGAGIAVNHWQALADY